MDIERTLILVLIFWGYQKIGSSLKTEPILTVKLLGFMRSVQSLP